MSRVAVSTGDFGEDVEKGRMCNTHPPCVFHITNGMYGGRSAIGVSGPPENYTHDKGLYTFCDSGSNTHDRRLYT